jgi:hypothetical protein
MTGDGSAGAPFEEAEEARRRCIIEGDGVCGTSIRVDPDEVVESEAIEDVETGCVEVGTPAISL